MKKRVHKFFAWLITFCMIATLFPVMALAQYSDVEGHWGQAVIEKWSQYGIIQGSDGAFRPDAPMTRGEIAVVISKVFQYQTAAENKFSDLDQAFYTAPLLKAAAAGVFSGDGATIRPKDYMTREEAAVIICKAFALEQTDGSVSFLDSNDVSPWAAGYVDTLARAGYMRGSEGKFNPKANITRAEIVTILNAAVAGFYSAAGEYTGNVQGTAVVNVSGVTLKDMEITGDLIIAQGVGSGEVTLDNVKVSGRTLVWGGGVDSVYIKGGSSLGALIISKTDDGGVRIVTSDGAVIEAVYVDDGKDDVILTGEFQDVIISGEIPVQVVGATIDKLEINANATVSIDKNTKVSQVVATENAEGASIEVKGTVTTLTAQAPVSVDNKGTISKAEVKADGVVIDGTKPSTITVDQGVDAPTDSDGNAVGGGTTGGGGGGGGGNAGGDGDSGPSVDSKVIAAPLVDNSTGDPITPVGYTVIGYENGQINISALDVPLHQNAADSPALGYWVGAAIEAPADVDWTEVKYYFGDQANQPAASTGLTSADAYTVGGKSYLAFYADAGVETPKTYIAIDWDGDGTTYAVKRYTLNLSGVQWTAIAPTIVTPAVADPLRHPNEGKYTVALSGNTINVNVTEALTSYLSATPAQGTAEWLAILVNTGKALTDLEYKTAGGFAAFAEADITEAQTVGATGDQTFVWWVKAEEAYGKTISIKGKDFPDKTAVTLTVNITSNIPAVATDYATLTAALGTSATTVTLQNSLTIDTENLAIPVGKTVVIPNGVTLTAEGTATLTGAGTLKLENGGTLDAASFNHIGGVVTSGTIEACAGSTIEIQAETPTQLIGSSTLNVTTGSVTITAHGASGTLLTLPAGSAATIMGAFMDASGEAYRIAKQDKFLVGGALTVDCDTNVSGKLEISTGGTLTINTGKMLSLVEVKADPVTYHGVLTNNGTVTNNGTLGVAEHAVIDGRNSVQGTIVHAAEIEATPIYIGSVDSVTTVVSVTGDTFTAGAEDLANWIFDYGTTGITGVTLIDLQGEAGTATGVSFDFHGSTTPFDVAAGTITIKADTGAMTSGVTSTTYELVILPALTDTPAITSGTPATFDTELTAGAGTLSPDTNLTYEWFRSDDNVYGEGTDVSLGTGTTYTPVEEDIGKYIILVAESADASGSAYVATDAVVAKAAGPAFSDTAEGTFPVAADSINLTGLGESTTGLEADVAIGGSDYDDSYTALTVDANGEATITGLTGVTSSTKVKIRFAETTTHTAGPDTEIGVTAE